MPWAATVRIEYNRKTDRYPSDIMDEEWAVFEPMVPPERPRGRLRTTEMREVINGFSTLDRPVASGALCLVTSHHENCAGVFLRLA